MKKYRILAFLMAGLLLCSLLTGCGKQAEPSSAPSSEAQAQTQAPSEEELVYYAEFIQLPQEVEAYSTPVLTGDAFYLTGYGVIGERTPTQEELELYPDQDWIYEEYGPSLWRLGTDGTAARLTGYEPPAAEREGYDTSLNFAGLTADPEGQLWLVEEAFSYQPEGEDYFSSYALCQVDDTGAVQNRIPLEFIGEDEKLTNPAGLCIDAQGRFYLYDYNSTVAVLDPTGQLLGTTTLPSWIDQMLTLSDGGVGVTYYEAAFTLKRFDPETMSLTGDNLTAGVEEDVYTFYPGSNGLLGSNGTSLFVQAADGSWTQELDFLDCDLSANEVQNVVAGEDGTFYVFTNYNGPEAEQYMAVIRQVPASQVPQREVLTLATTQPYTELDQVIAKFNRTSNTYRVTMKDYSSYTTEANLNGAQTQLISDILSGNGPDLIDMNGLSQDLLARKGCLEDLLPLLDGDEAMDPADLLPCVRSCGTDGKLYTAFCRFEVRTVAGLTELVGDTPGWTWDELLALQAQHPEVRLFDVNTTQDWILQMLAAFSLEDYVNYYDGTCSFNSPSFASLLEFAATFPAQEPAAYVDEYDAIMNGDQLLSACYVADLSDLNLYPTLFGGEVTWIGFPTADGQASGAALQPTGGQIAICAASSHKDGAWEFVRGFLNGDFSSDWPWGFSVSRKTLEAETSEWLKQNTMYDEDGNLMSTMGIGWGEGTMLEIYPPTQAQIDAFFAAVDGIDRIMSYDTEILAIISEEAGAFFAGQCTAQAAADIIQGRVSIYMSERQ